ncbi:hypothetical protein QF022_003846 [Vogesella perlucida]|jgi:hypothetical protein|nr:hypothetical protein [Vogesella perlucida]
MTADAKLALQDYARLTSQLLLLAQTEKWDDWLLLLAQRDRCFEQWQALQHKDQMDDETRAIVRETLQSNQQMEALVVTRHQELAELLHSARQQHKLSSTYR